MGGHTGTGKAATTTAITGNVVITDILNGVARTVVMANTTIEAILDTITVESIDSPYFNLRRNNPA